MSAPKVFVDILRAAADARGMLKSAEASGKAFASLERLFATNSKVAEDYSKLISGEMNVDTWIKNAQDAADPAADLNLRILLNDGAFKMALELNLPDMRFNAAFRAEARAARDAGRSVDLDAVRAQFKGVSDEAFKKASDLLDRYEAILARANPDFIRSVRTPRVATRTTDTTEPKVTASTTKATDEVREAAAKAGGETGGNKPKEKIFEGGTRRVPSIGKTNGTEDFVEHITAQYYISSKKIFGDFGLFGKGELTDEIIEGAVSSSKIEELPLGGLGRHFAKEIDEAVDAGDNLKIRLQDISQKYKDSVLDPLDKELTSLNAKLAEIEARLKVVKTREDFIGKSLLLKIKTYGFNPFNFLRVTPYLPFEHLKNVERVALLDLKKIVEQQVLDLQDITQKSRLEYDRIEKLIDSAPDDAALKTAADSLAGNMRQLSGDLLNRVTAEDPLKVNVLKPQTGEQEVKTLRDRLTAPFDPRGTKEGLTPYQYRRFIARSVRESYINPYSRTTDVTIPDRMAENSERASMDIETFWESSRGGAASDPTDRPKMAGSLFDLYKMGQEQEALYAIRHFFYRQGGKPSELFGVKGLASGNYFPVGVFGELRKAYRDVYKAEPDKHFEFFIKKLEQVVDDNKLSHNPAPVWRGGQREIERAYEMATYWPRYSIRHRWNSTIATPGIEHYLTQPVGGYYTRRLNWEYLSGRKIDWAKTKEAMKSDGSGYKYVFVPREGKNPFLNFGARAGVFAYRLAKDPVFVPLHLFAGLGLKPAAKLTGVGMAAFLFGSGVEEIGDRTGVEPLAKFGDTIQDGGRYVTWAGAQAVNYTPGILVARTVNPLDTGLFAFADNPIDDLSNIILSGTADEWGSSALASNGWKGLEAATGRVPAAAVAATGSTLAATGGVSAHSGIKGTIRFDQDLLNAAAEKKEDGSPKLDRNGAAINPTFTNFQVTLETLTTSFTLPADASDAEKAFHNLALNRAAITIAMTPGIKFHGNGAIKKIKDVEKNDIPAYLATIYDNAVYDIRSEDLSLIGGLITERELELAPLEAKEAQTLADFQIVKDDYNRSKTDTNKERKETAEELRDAAKTEAQAIRDEISELNQAQSKLRNNDAVSDMPVGTAEERALRSKTLGHLSAFLTFSGNPIINTSTQPFFEAARALALQSTKPTEDEVKLAFYAAVLKPNSGITDTALRAKAEKEIKSWEEAQERKRKRQGRIVDEETGRSVSGGGGNNSDVDAAMDRAGEFVTGWALNGQFGKDVSTIAGAGLSGAWNFVTNIPKMKNGDVITGYLVGGASALFLTNIVKGWLGPIGKIPGIGLLIGAALFFGAGKMAHMMVTDGDGTHAPNTVTAMRRDTVVQTTAPAAVTASSAAASLGTFRAAASATAKEGDDESAGDTGETGQTRKIEGRMIDLDGDGVLTEQGQAIALEDDVYLQWSDLDSDGAFAVQLADGSGKTYADAKILSQMAAGTGINSTIVVPREVLDIAFDIDDATIHAINHSGSLDEKKPIIVQFKTRDGGVRPIELKVEQPAALQ